MFNFNAQQRGFTLIETLVAIFIFSISLVGLSTIASRGIAGVRGSSNEIIAQYLVQEGIEAMRHIRDSNYASMLNGGTETWSDGITNTCPEGDQCIISVKFDSAPFAEIQECDSECAPLRLDENTSLYQYARGPVTPFVRTVTWESGATSEEIIITSEVVWEEGRIEKTTTASEIMRHWQNI